MKNHITDCKGKAFHNFRRNGVHFNFPNGNAMSVIWGSGSYSENHDVWGTDSWDADLPSNDVEIMFSCPSSLKKKILKKYHDGEQDPIGYLSMEEFVEIFKLLSATPSSPKVKI